VIALLLLPLLAAAPDSSSASTAARDSSASVARPDSAAPALVAPTTIAPAPRPVVTLPEVRVERERALSDARRRLPTASVTELAAGSSNRALETLSEVLAEAAGVHVQQYGGLGAFSTLSLRGAPAGQVTVFLDGAPLSSAAHGAVNLADLPVTAVERVEVYRGLAPLELGVATPGGAINLVTASSPAVRELRIARGAFDTWEGRATGGAARGDFSGLLHLGIQSSHGNFDYLDDNGTPLNPADDEVHERWNNRFDATTALGTLHWSPAPEWRVTAREDAFHKAQGVPGMGATPALHARLTLLRSLTQLEAVRSGTGLVPNVTARSTLERERTRFRDMVNEPKPYELGPTRHDTDDRLGSESGGLDLEWPSLLPGLSFETGASERGERAALHDPVDGYTDPPESFRRTQGVMAALQWRPLGERVTLHAAKRWDRIADHLRSVGVANLLTTTDVVRELASPQLGARVVAPLGVELRANWARAERVPDFTELFGNQGSVLGNPALRPEHAENWDAGAAWNRSFAHGRGASLEWMHYESRPRDLILYVRSSQNTARAMNVTSARIHGEELSVRASAAPGVALSGSFTWQSALDDGPISYWHGKRLPQRPGRQAYARCDLSRGPARLSGDVQYIADNYLDPYNLYRVASRTLVGASVSAALTAGARLVIEGKNLGDNHVSDVGGFPLPGRSVWVACELRLGPTGSIRN